MREFRVRGSEFRGHAAAALALILAAGCTAWAEEKPLDLEVKTPAIERLREAAAARAAAVQELKDGYFVGEGRDGLLAVRALEKIPLARKKEIQDVVAAENADRRALYLEILKAHDLPESELPRLMRLAAEKRYAESAPGHYVQHPEDGRWVVARDVQSK
ncbi:MAG: YdbL family protein [Planctomycetota bacterium]|nr:YdbL family protein [Planctomycetota bacterium]